MICAYLQVDNHFPMATKERFKWSEIKKGSPYFSGIKTTIEIAFMGNNVYPVQTLKEAYKLASESPRTVVTDIPVYGAGKDRSFKRQQSNAFERRCRKGPLCSRKKNPWGTGRENGRVRDQDSRCDL